MYIYTHIYILFRDVIDFLMVNGIFFQITKSNVIKNILFDGSSREKTDKSSDLLLETTDIITCGWGVAQ